MKKTIKILIIIALVANLSGCWNRRELNTLGIVMGVGVDTSEKEDEIMVTAQLVNTKEMSSSSSKSSSGDSGGTGSSAYINLEGEGTDVMSIFRGFTHKISRKLYIAHTQIIIFGEDAAKDGVHDTLDFFLRDHESRLTMNILVADGDATDIFGGDPEFTKIPSSEIQQLLETQGATSETSKLNVLELMTNLTSKTAASVAPIVELKDEEDKKILLISGGAVFKEDKMVGKLNKKETRGFLWVMNKVKSGIMRVNVKEENANLEIIKASSEVTPEIKKDGTIVMKIKVTNADNISSHTGSESLGTEENVKIMKKATEELIKDEIETAFNKSKDLDADIFGFGESIHRKYPKEWKDLEENWDELYKDIKLEIDIKVNITGLGRLAKPDYPESES